MLTHADVLSLAGVLAGVFLASLLAVCGVVWMLMHDRRRTESFTVAMVDRMLVRHYNEIAASSAMARGAAGVMPYGTVPPPEDKLDRDALQKARERAKQEADEALAAARA